MEFGSINACRIWINTTFYLTSAKFCLMSVPWAILKVNLFMQLILNAFEHRRISCVAYGNRCTCRSELKTFVLYKSSHSYFAHNLHSNWHQSHMRCHNAGKTSLFVWKTTLVNKATAKPSQKAAIFEWQRLSNLTSSKESSRPWQLILPWNSLPPWAKISFAVSRFWFCPAFRVFAFVVSLIFNLAASYLLLGVFFGFSWNEKFGFAMIYLIFSATVFGCAVRYLVVPWDIWLCSELFGCAVHYLSEKNNMAGTKSRSHTSDLLLIGHRNLVMKVDRLSWVLALWFHSVKPHLLYVYVSFSSAS